MTIIDDYTFSGCNSLKTVSFPLNLTSIGSNAFSNCSNLSSITIPSSVRSIGSYAFDGCSNLTSVVYLGSKEQNVTDIFRRCDQLKFVCVASKYTSSSFCGLDQFCKHESCESFIHDSNQCYEPLCKNGNITMEKRENATEWENRSTGCYEFECDYESGPIFWNNCTDTDHVCENDMCVMKEDDVSHTVVIEVEEIQLLDLKMNEIQDTISNLTSIEADKLRIRVDTNEKNEIIRLIVIVDDEETAIIVNEKVNQCAN